MLKILKQGEARLNVIEYEGVVFLRVSHGGFNLSEVAPHIDAMYIETTDEDVINGLVSKVRESNKVSEYLMPVFASSIAMKPALETVVDGFVRNMDFFQAARQTREIQERIGQIKYSEVGDENYDDYVLKTLSFLFSRNQALMPFRKRNSSTGYAYPFLCNLDHADGFSQLEYINTAVQDGLLNTTLVDKVNHCPHCSDTFLHFRESCSSCGSIDLKYEDLIHHFKCAHVAPLSDFVQGDKLCCPKCDNELRHIGIDYDKPSEITVCNTCNHQSQETNMTVHCMGCGKESSLSELNTHDVNSFEITEKGIVRAINGKKTQVITKHKQVSSNVIEWDLFKLYLRQETKRAQLSGSPAAMVSIRLNAEALWELSTHESGVLQHEVLNILSSYIRPTDLVAARNIFDYQIIVTMGSTEYVEELKHVVEVNLIKLIKDNLQIESCSVEVFSEELGGNANMAIV
ncbi:hypothetical protein EYV94_16070 [Puteibacter caeruleilacunae]|nr:hypothetical protein EYV94_16070 [Puteibacter caeruleilacunae]